MKGWEIYPVSCPSLPHICGGGEAVFEGGTQGATYQKHSELVHPFILRGRPWEEISVQWSSLQRAVPDYLRHVYIEGTDVAPTLLSLRAGPEV